MKGGIAVSAPVRWALEDPSNYPGRLVLSSHLYALPNPASTMALT